MTCGHEVLQARSINDQFQLNATSPSEKRIVRAYPIEHLLRLFKTDLTSLTVLFQYFSLFTAVRDVVRRLAQLPLSFVVCCNRHLYIGIRE